MEFRKEQTGKGQPAWAQKNKGRGGKEDTSTHACTSVFIVGMEWMASISMVGNTEGQIPCPHCAAIVGSWMWKGKHCSCGRSGLVTLAFSLLIYFRTLTGTWIEPALQISKGKIREMKKG